jgi:hypothetical protein
MQRHLIQQLFHAALLMLVLASVGHLHGHAAAEPHDEHPHGFTVHFENFGKHAATHITAHHDDDLGLHATHETELVPQALLSKSIDHDAPLFLLSLCLLFIIRQVQPPPLPTLRAGKHYYPPPDLLPPPRAPPVDSL